MGQSAMSSGREISGEGWTGPGPPIPVHIQIGDSDFYATCHPEGGKIVCRNSDREHPDAPLFRGHQIPETEGYSYLCSGENNGVLAAFQPGNPGKVKLIPLFQTPTLYSQGNTLQWHAEVPFGGIRYSLIRTDHGRPIYEITPKRPGTVTYEDKTRDPGKQYSYYLWCKGMTADTKSNVATVGGASTTSAPAAVQLAQPTYQNGAVQLQWNNTGGAYRLFRESEDGEETILPFSRTTGFTDTSAEPGKTYHYNLVSSNGGTVTSSTQTFTVPTLTSTSVARNAAGVTTASGGGNGGAGSAGITATAVCHPAGIFVSWIGGTAPYAVVRTGGNGPDITFGTINGNNILDNHSLVPGASYTYTISTVNTATLISGKVTFVYNCGNGGGGTANGGATSGSAATNGSTATGITLPVLFYNTGSSPWISITWSGGSPPYSVWKNGVILQSGITGTSAVDLNPGPPGTGLTYQVRDAAGNSNANSTDVPGSSLAVDLNYFPGMIVITWAGGLPPYSVQKAQIPGTGLPSQVLMTSTYTSPYSDSNPGPVGSTWQYVVTDSQGTTGSSKITIPGSSWTTTHIILIVIAVIVVILIIVLIVYAMNRPKEKVPVAPLEQGQVILIE